MKLENKFFQNFFSPFLSGVILSTLIVLILLGLFTNNYYDKSTSQNIINFRKKYSKIIINSANILITNKFLKFQIGLNEIVIYYQRMANKLLISNKNYTLNNAYLKSAFNLADDFCHNMPEGTEHMAIWLIDKETTEEKLEEKKDVKHQLIAFSNIIQNLEAILDTNKPDSQFFFFYFDKTELYLTFPLDFECQSDFVTVLKYHNYHNTKCLDNNGKFYTTMKVKCETFFITIMKSKTNAFDNNYLSNQEKSIYINNYFGPTDYESSGIKEDRKFDICVEFDDPITNGKGYACTNSPYEDVISSLDDLNSKIDGYYFVANVGYNHVFYFPEGTITPKTLTENIFKWGIKYILNEKTYFHEHIRKIMSSNYIENISDSIYDEVYANGKNSNDQFFYVNGEKFKYSIYPIILENIKGQKEHIMSLIYIYKDEFFFDEINEYIDSIAIKIILELLIFIIFGSGLLYIIYLTFSILTKYIVIPIKNVNYMLKGINIGGKNRLKYLCFLKRKQEENLEKLEKISLFQNKNINNENNEITNDETINNYDEIYHDDNLIDGINTEEKEINNKNKYSDFNKIYDEESNYIEKEFNFYDFDDQSLQYRPLEIENLLTLLLNLKSAILLTSKDREVKQIIDYSFTDKIFRNINNKEGATICQSNIGNMQSQLLKFDKAIYHLALSLQDNKLKKFIDQNLNDELDENDSLLNKISNFYCKTKTDEKNNILVEKQINNYKNNFSQKLIGILINNRYCRLIHSYYMFFKNIQKLKKTNDYTVNKQFMNTKFHTINYYNKIIIQYIFLSYTKNDLVKIGESILNYLEFLIKFKFKTSSENKYFMKIKGKNRREYKTKQDFKKKIFNKIIGWFNLFDDYIYYVKNNSSLIDTKCIVDDYSHNANNENFEFNLESQTSFMIRVNIQKNNFLKGKFSLCCKNYVDALYYFIKAAKKECIVIDGLIKKKSLKRINKLLIKMNKKYEKFGLKNLNIEKQFKEFEKDKRKIFKEKSKYEHKNLFIAGHSTDIKNITFNEEIITIKEIILHEINECKAKKEKDIIILIDFNIYTKQQKNIYSQSNIIDMFIEETKDILNDYLSTNDRLGVIIYQNDYKIICPLVCINKIDNEIFLKDLLYYKNNISNHEKITYMDPNDVEFNLLENNIISEPSQEGSFDMSEKEEKLIDKIKGLVNTINYLIYYSRMKDIKNDKYYILFTDIFNLKLNEDEQIVKIIDFIKNDENGILLLVGKNKKFEEENRNSSSSINDKIIEEIILKKFGEKSEIIYIENMKKIKTILCNNKVIKDEIFYPNEIYK